MDYMFKILGLYMLEECRKFEGKDATGKVLTDKGLKELAVTSAGLKALTTFEACKGLEELRLCCGGNGYLLHSGIAYFKVEELGNVTAEGDFSLMLLVLARFLLKGA